MAYIETRTIREMDEERWDSITGAVLSMTHRWQRVMETYWRSFRPYYLLLEDRQGPCVAVIANTSTDPGDPGLLGWLYQHLSLAISPPYSSMCGVMVRPGVSMESVIPRLEAALLRLCRREKRLFLAIDNLHPSDLPAWQQAGFLAFPLVGLNILDLPSTYDSYLESLYPKHRSELRRIRKRSKEFEVRFEIGPPSNDGEQIYSLLCEVFAEHGTSLRAMPFTSQFFTGLEREMPGDALFIRGYVGQRLAGVSLCLLNASTLWWPMAGLRYEIARPSYLYFLLIDEMIRWSIAHGIKKIVGGKTNEREKQRHGFHLEECWLCYRASMRPLNRVLPFALPFVRRLRRQ